MIAYFRMLKSTEKLFQVFQPTLISIYFERKTKVF